MNASAARTPARHTASDLAGDRPVPYRHTAGGCDHAGHIDGVLDRDADESVRPVAGGSKRVIQIVTRPTYAVDDVILNI